MKSTALQWIVPAIVAFALLAAHFGYNEIRVQHHSDRLDGIDVQIDRLDSAQDDLTADVLSRLVRIETRQEIILESLERLSQ